MAANSKGKKCKKKLAMSGERLKNQPLIGKFSNECNQFA
jgi:hypothetical protein